MEESPTKSCPKCGKRNDKDAIECQRCGIIFEKYEQIQRRKMARPSSNAQNNLKQCQDCGGTISKNAEMCPHCGAKGHKANQSKAPTSKKDVSAFQTIKAVIILFVIIFGAWSIFFKSDPPKENSTNAAVNVKQTKKELTEAEKEQLKIERERKKAEEYELCKKDLRCWGDKHAIKATIASQDRIEKYAKYDFKWTDGILGSKMTKFRWLNQEKLTLVYLGDEIQFQNKLGNWVRYSYRVDYDPINKKLLNVSVSQGRLP